MLGVSFSKMPLPFFMDSYAWRQVRKPEAISGILNIYSTFFGEGIDFSDNLFSDSIL